MVVLKLEKALLNFLNYISALIFVLLFLNASSQSVALETLQHKLETKVSGFTALEVLEAFVREDLEGLTSQEKVSILNKIWALPAIEQDNQLKLFLGVKIAGLYTQLGQSDLSLKMYFEVLPLAERYEDFVSLAIINTGMGSEYFFLKDYEKAIIRFKNAYKINKAYRDSSEIAGSISNIGTTFSRLGEADSALYYINLGLSYFTALKDTSKIAKTLNNKGSLYHRQKGRTREALAFFEEALRLHTLTSNRYEAGVSYINLGVIYYELKDSERGIQYIKKALANAKELNNILLLRLSLENITEMYVKQAQYDSAFYYQKEWIALNDTLNTSAQKSVIEDLENEYKQNQLEQDKKIAELKIKVLNTWIIIAVLTILILLILTLYFLYNKRVKEELEFTKSKFYANLAHEFRTPVSLIKSPAQQILRNSKDEATRNRSAMIIKSADQLLALFNQLLDVSKLDEGKMNIQEVPCDVVDLSTSLINQLTPLSNEKKIKITFQSAFKERFILLDPSIYQKVFLNLMTNALKFSPIEGEIKVNLSDQKEEKEAFIVIDIIDQGTGIDSTTRQRLFKRFNHATAPNNPNGIGLGLSLSKELMQIIGGDVSLKKTSKNGSTFRIKLKLKEIEKKALDFNNTKQNQDETVTILLVDDHETLLSHLAQELGSHYSCHTALNGKEGLEKAIQLIPDVIISDIAMPEMDGVSMAKKIKEHELTEHIPIMLLTAKTSKIIKHRSLEAGVVSYMNKPFDIEEIKHQLNNFINWRETLKEKYSAMQLKTREQEGLLKHPSAFVHRIIAIVENHLDDNKFSIEQLAGELFLSRAQVHRKIKATTGISSSALVRNIRLEKAYQMLTSNKDLNVNEVAYSCGFSGPSYFTKSFVDYFGQKPSEV